MTEHPCSVRPGHPRGGRAAAPGAAPGERGAVTAEYAVLLPAAVLVLVAVLLAGAAAVQQVRAQDAAASAARILARGDTVAEACAAVVHMAGDDADCSTDVSDGWATVTVVHAGPGPLAAVRLEGAASAPVQHPDLEVGA